MKQAVLTIRPLCSVGVTSISFRPTPSAALRLGPDPPRRPQTRSGLLLSEHAVGSKHEHSNKQQIAGNIAKSTPQVRVEIPLPKLSVHPDDHCGNNGADYAVEPADNNDREYFETDQRNPKAAARLRRSTTPRRSPKSRQSPAQTSAK